MSKKSKLQSGFVLPLIALMLFFLCGISALSFDVGFALYNKRRIQQAADMSALAAAAKISTTATDTSVTTEADTIGTQNRLANGEIVSVECGHWLAQNKTFIPCSGSALNACTSCAHSDTNAIRVKTSRSVNTTFGRVLGKQTLTPDAASIVHFKYANSSNCIKPFGIYNAFLTNVSIGQTFTISTNGQANWGKIDLAGVNMSSGNNYENEMLYNKCGTSSNPIQVGTVVTPGTGNAGTVGGVFNQLVSNNLHKNMIFAVTSQFPNGNSGNVTIQEFVTVDFVSGSGNGSNWSGTFRLVARNATPTTGNGSGTLIARTIMQ